MSTLRSLLEKARLIEPDQEQVAEDIQSSDSDIPADLEKYLEAGSTSSVATSMESVVPVAEGVSVEEIYALAGVPASTFPIEKLMKLLDGLKAMTPEMQKAAISAMDSADDSWTLQDITADGNGKINALESFKNMKKDEENAFFVDVENKIAVANTEGDELVAQLRTQIAELQLQLDKTVAQTNETVLLLKNSLEEKKAATQREVVRVDEQINTLRKTLSQIV